MLLKTYDNLRQEKQLTTEAIALIAAKDKRKVQKQWKNFLCCRMKQNAKAGVDSDDEE